MQRRLAAVGRRGAGGLQAVMGVLPSQGEVGTGEKRLVRAKTRIRGKGVRRLVRTAKKVTPLCILMYREGTWGTLTSHLGMFGP